VTTSGTTPGSVCPSEPLPCPVCERTPREKWHGLGYSVACHCEQPACIGMKLETAIEEWNERVLDREAER